MRSLIVDDDYTCRYILQLTLSRYGQCDMAADGYEALKYFKESLDKQNPYDVVIIDIMMPELNGNEVLKEIRKIEYQRGIPDYKVAKAILMTSLDDEINREIKYELRENFETYLVKSPENQDLLDKLTELGFSV